MGKPAFDPTKDFDSGKPEFDSTQSFTKTGQQPAGAAAVGNVNPEPEGEGSRLLTASVNAIPTIAGAGGGLAGATLGPFGALGAGGLAYAAGAKLRDIIQNARSGGPQKSGGILDYLNNVKTGVEQEAGGQLTGKMLSTLSPLLTRGYTAMRNKVGEAVTGIPESTIAAYADRYPEVNALQKTSGAASEALDGKPAPRGNVDLAAEEVKNKILNDVDAFKAQQNATITNAIKKGKVTDRVSGAWDADPSVGPTVQSYYYPQETPETSTPVPPQSPMYPPSSSYDPKLNSSPGPEPIVPLAPQTSTLAKPPAQSGLFNIKPILTSLEAKGIDPVAKGQVQNLKQIIGAQADKDGNVDIEGLNNIRQYLQDHAEGAFKSSKLGFTVGTDTAHAAKSAWATTKNIMDTQGPEAIKAANDNLFQLHNVEDNLNSSLLEPGKSDSPLMEVGRGTEGPNRTALLRLGKLTGNDYITPAENLSAMATFKNPSILPGDKSAKTAVRMGLGYGLGGATGGAIAGVVNPALIPLGTKVGSTAGLAASSPLAFKALLDLGRGVSPTAQAAKELLASPFVQRLLNGGAGIPAANQLTSSLINRLGISQNQGEPQ